MSVAKQISNQRAIVADLPGSFAVAHASGLHDAAVISHNIHETDEPIVQNGEFLPAECIDVSLSVSCGLSRFGRYRFLRHEVSIPKLDSKYEFYTDDLMLDW